MCGLELRPAGHPIIHHAAEVRIRIQLMKDTNTSLHECMQFIHTGNQHAFSTVGGV